MSKHSEKSKPAYNEFLSLTYSESQQYLKGTENQKVRDIIAGIVSDGSVLDVGCGNGIDAIRYKPNQYLGVDISENLVKVAKERNPEHKFISGNICDIIDKFILDDINFDVIVCKAVLEHVPSEKDALEIFNRMLKVGKTILIGWHTPPIYKKTKIIRCMGHFNKIVYQNHYKKDLFDIKGVNILKKTIDNYELWIIKKNKT